MASEPQEPLTLEEVADGVRYAGAVGAPSEYPTALDALRAALADSTNRDEVEP